ncbi:MAG: DUF126 domain-containing protein [Pigmentiphaga sp.]|nr:DUF126 domain-containing protein [Pigmentiphaga sp.]
MTITSTPKPVTIRASDAAPSDAGSIAPASAPSPAGTSAAAAAPTTAEGGFTLQLRGRGIVPGVAEGEALVTRQHISGWGGIDSRTGTVVETHHELRGISFAGKVLLFPGAKGSSGWSNAFHLTRTMGVAPAAMLFTEMTTKIALGAVVTRAPSVTDFDRDPFECIENGDWVRVDGDRGIVEVRKRDPGVRG